MADATLARSVRDRLAKLAGPDSLIGDVQRFEVRGAVPRAVVAPASADAAAAVLAACSAEGWTVECGGAGTWLRHGRTPAHVDVVVTTSRIAGIAEYEPADLTIGLRAGTTVESAHASTSAHDQELPLDGPAAPGATVGAMLATASAGPLRPAHGAPRDQALGIEVVTGDGRVLRFGGRVVKNVAGYDIVRLLVGSRGTLGLITAAHLRLRARPERDVTLVAEAPGHAVLLEAARAAALVEPAALELVHEGAHATWRLFSRLRGNAEAVDDACRRLRDLVPDFAAMEPGQARAAWDRLARTEAEADTGLRARTRATTLADTLGAVLPIGATLPSGWTVAAHALDGTVRLLAPGTGPWENATLDAFAAAVERARAALAPAGGTLHVPVPPPGAGAAFDAYGADPALLPLMRRLRQTFDPDGILAPGRFVL